MTLNPKVYKINRSHRLLVGKNSKSIISHIINTTFKKLDYKKSFEVESLKTIEKDNFTYFLYLFKSDEVASDWQDFLPNGLTQNENFNETKISLILFIETDDHIFCVIGGNASYQIILPFIDQSYGLNQACRR